ncbi:MAG: GIY-YIG nuclease family protein [Minisyncoccia bacterium]
MNTRNYYVYILTNVSDSVFYTGVTNDLKKRTYEHKHKLIKGFSSRYHLEKLVYYETFDDINSAIRREKQLKNWHRDWKINLVVEVNPGFSDLNIE